jgi:hypothetical protein
MCNCEFCQKCKVCGHKADEHICGDGPCFMKGCYCTSFDDSWHQKGLELEQFADIELGEEKD